MLLFKRIAFPLIRDLRERLREYRKLLNEHEATRRELISREQQLRSLIENLPGGAFRYDVDAEKIVFVSEQIEELTGCSCEDFYENTLACLYELLGEETFRRRAQALDVLMNNTQYVLDYPITKRNGKTIWVREQGHQIYDPAKKIHWLDAVIYDITIEKLTQEQLNRRVEEGISKLRDKDEMLLHNARLAAMGEMVGMIAHQWRQPISVIGMIANNMLLDIELDTLEAARSRDELNQINDEVQYLSQTIEDFTGFFKPKSEREVCTLGDLVDDTLKIVGKSLANNDIEVIESVDRDYHVEVYRSEMVQVLLNLFKNAQDIFKEEGRRDGKIFIESYPEEEQMVLAVEDNGGGIAEEVMPKVFEPYFSTKQTQNGTGVGLYMSKMIVEEHHSGTIRVRNNGNGARFEVVI